MARTRYQHGEIITKHGKTHDSFMGRWREDTRLPNGSVVRRKRSQVLGIVGQITEKQAYRKLEGMLARVMTLVINLNAAGASKLSRRNGVRRHSQR